MAKPFPDRVIFFVGKLAAMSRADTRTLCRGNGARVVAKLSPRVNTIVVGQGERLGKDWIGLTEKFDAATRAAFESGELEILTETELWGLFGLPVAPVGDDLLYTPAMLSELTDAPVYRIRQWLFAGLLKARRTIGDLACFDFTEILAVRQILSLLRHGLSLREISEALSDYEKLFPEEKRVLLQLTPMLDGQTILFRKEGELFDRRGCRCFDLSEAVRAAEEEKPSEKSPPGQQLGPTAADEFDDPPMPEMPEMPSEAVTVFLTEEEKRRFQRHLGENVVALCESAWELEEDRYYDEAIDCYRAALLGGGPDAGVSFQLAELLSRVGDDSAARERYYITLEMEEDHLEARAGLGRVLVRLGEYEKAVAVYQGALAIHPDYLEVRFELGRLFFRLRRYAEAEEQLLHYRSDAPNAPQIDEVDHLLKNIREYRRGSQG